MVEGKVLLPWGTLSCLPQGAEIKGKSRKKFVYWNRFTGLLAQIGPETSEQRRRSMSKKWDQIPAINELDIANKRVFMRLDLNVPLKDGEVADDTRLRAVLPTINYALARSARLVLASHLGRPKGQIKSELSMQPVAKRLSALLAEKIGRDPEKDPPIEIMVSDFPVGECAKKLAQDLRGGEIVLLENLRWDPRETKNGEEYAKELASYAEVYINDAFGTVHRAHASTAGVVSFKNKGQYGVGFLIKKEIEALGKLLHEPATPFVAIMGGAKVSDKIGLIRSLMKQCQVLLIGGAMAYTFLKAKGLEIGSSRFEETELDLARSLLEQAKREKVEICLPVDHIAATAIEEDAETRVVQTPLERELLDTEQGFDSAEMGLDIGPKSREIFAKHIESAGKVVWNGPMGVFEVAPFAGGTLAVAQALAKSSAYTVVGGGDSAAAIRKFNLHKKVDHVSTGGGASLSFLQGEFLPGLEVLCDEHY